MSSGDAGRSRRARKAARQVLQAPARKGWLGPQKPHQINLAFTAYWETPSLKDIAARAPRDRAAWEGCVLALRTRKLSEPDMDFVVKVAARAMNHEIKRPREKRRFLTRDRIIVMAVYEAVVATGAPRREAWPIAFNAVSEVLNELAVGAARGRNFTSHSINAIWRRRTKLPPERFRVTAIQ